MTVLAPVEARGLEAGAERICLREMVTSAVFTTPEMVELCRCGCDRVTSTIHKVDDWIYAVVSNILLFTLN